MAYLLLITGLTNIDRELFANVLSGVLSYNSFESRILFMRDVFSAIYHDRLKEMSGEGLFVDNDDIIDQFFEKERQKSGLTKKELVTNNIMLYTGIGKEIIILPDISDMTLKVELLPICTGIVKLEDSNSENNGPTISTGCDADMTFSVGDETDIIESAIVYAKEFMSFFDNDDEGDVNCNDSIGPMSMNMEGYDGTEEWRDTL